MTDFGLFGPSSITWRIHGDPATLIGGLRALLVQALNPLAMAAVDQHSDYRADPWGRLRRTSEYLTATTFGDTETALRAAAKVRSIHRRVSGIDPFTGRAYRADDPALLLWVHCVEVESFLLAYRTYAGPVKDPDADRYVLEMVRAAELVGLQASDVPATTGELNDYLAAAPDLVLSPAAKEGARYILAPPMPLPLRPVWAIPVTAAIAILPERARALYELRWWRPATTIVRASVFAVLRVLNLTVPPPPSVRRAIARGRSLAA